MCPNPSTKGPGDDDEGQTKPGRAQGKLQRFRCMQAGSLVWLAEPHNQSIHIPTVCTKYSQMVTVTRPGAGRQAGCGSFLSCLQRLLLFLQLGLVWCKVQVLGCRAAVMREDGFELPTCSLTRSLVHFPQPPSGRCGHQNEGPLHNRRSVAVLPGRPGHLNTAHRSGLATLSGPRGSRLSSACSGPGRDSVPYDSPLTR